MLHDVALPDLTTKGVVGVDDLGGDIGKFFEEFCLESSVTILYDVPVMDWNDPPPESIGVLLGK